MIVLDTTALSLLFVPGATANRKGESVPIKYAKERVQSLVDSVADDDGSIIIPTPALAEVIVRYPHKADELLSELRSSPWFRVEPFDSIAAIELGTRTAKAIADGDKREGSQADWTKVKFDRQIVAVGLVNRASLIISNDPDVKAIGGRWGIDVKGVEELPLPPALVPPPLLEGLEDSQMEVK